MPRPPIRLRSRQRRLRLWRVWDPLPGLCLPDNEVLERLSQRDAGDKVSQPDTTTLAPVGGALVVIPSPDGAADLLADLKRLTDS